MAEKKADEIVKVEKAVKATAKKAEPKPVVAKEKYTKVISKITGKRFIGGEWYQLERDKEIEVTEDAKRSLREAGAIYL